MSRVNIVKRIKIGVRWKMFSIPRNAKGNYDWNAIADGRYYVEWYAGESPLGCHAPQQQVASGRVATSACAVRFRGGAPGFSNAEEWTSC